MSQIHQTFAQVSMMNHSQEQLHDASECIILQSKDNSGGDDDLIMTPEFIPNPPQNDTVTLAILQASNYLDPATATVRDCLQKYIQMKIEEVKRISKDFNDAFLMRLTEMEDQIITSAAINAPTNSEA